MRHLKFSQQFVAERGILIYSEITEITEIFYAGGLRTWLR
jgi:hypothetical protein